MTLNCSTPSYWNISHTEDHQRVHHGFRVTQSSDRGTPALGGMCTDIVRGDAERPHRTESDVVVRLWGPIEFAHDQRGIDESAEEYVRRMVDQVEAAVSRVHFAFTALAEEIKDNTSAQFAAADAEDRFMGHAVMLEAQLADIHAALATVTEKRAAATVAEPVTVPDAEPV